MRLIKCLAARCDCGLCSLPDRRCTRFQFWQDLLRLSVQHFVSKWTDKIIAELLTLRSRPCELLCLQIHWACQVFRSRSSQSKAFERHCHPRQSLRWATFWSNWLALIGISHLTRSSSPPWRPARRFWEFEGQWVSVSSFVLIWTPLLRFFLSQPSSLLLTLIFANIAAYQWLLVPLGNVPCCHCARTNWFLAWRSSFHLVISFSPLSPVLAFVLFDSNLVSYKMLYLLAYLAIYHLSALSTIPIILISASPGSA